MNNRIRYDLRGRPFKYPACILDGKEYAKIVSEINTNYEMYRGKVFSIHYSVGIDNCYYIYFFENHGFNGYNIYDRYRT